MSIKNPDNNNIQFLDGGGELGTLTREKDWSKTSLGAPQYWPQSLRTSLSIILNSRFPMFLFWGKELISFYNDAFRPSLGKDGKHPAILGMKGEDAWAEIWPTIKPLIDQVLAGGEAIWAEDQLIPIYRNGKIEDVYWTFSYSPVNDESGKPAGVFVTCTETTEKINIHRELEKSKNELEFAIDSAELGTWDYNPVTNKFSSNERLKKWFGLSAEEHIELTHAVNAMYESDRERVTQAIQKALEFSSGGNYDIEYTIIHPTTKAETIVRAKGRAWFNNENIAYRFNGTLQDVTEQAIARKRIEESEDRFRTMADNIPNLAWMAKADGWIYWYNKRWYDYTGTTPEDMEGWGWQSVHDPSTLPNVMKKWKIAIAEGKPFEMVFPLKGADGKYRQFLTRILPVRNDAGEIYHWFGSNTDITDQKKIEEALQQSNSRFANNIKLAPVAMSIFKGKNHVVEIANELMLELWGKKADEVIGKPIFEGLPEAKGQGLESIIDTVFSSGEKFVAYERPVSLPRNGVVEPTYINFVYEPLTEVDGTVSGIIAVASDITVQVLSRIRIEQSEARFRSLITQLPMPTVFLKGPEQIIEIANSAMLKRWGRTAQALSNKKFADVFPEVKEQKFAALLEKVYNTGVAHRETETPSFFLVNGEKKMCYIDFEYSPLFESDGKVSGIIATVNDVTEKVLATKKIEASEKRYHNLIYSSPSAIGILYGEDLVITIANDAIIELWGKGKEIMGKAYFEALPELAEQGYKDVFGEVYRTGIPFNAVESPVNILQNGKMQLKYYNFLLYPQRNFDGEVDGIGIIATEVTSQALMSKQVLESEKRFRLLADSMPQHIWTSDLAGNLNYFNQSVFNYSGLSPEQINKDGWLQIVHPEDREGNIKEWTNAIQTGKDFIFEHRFRRYDGEYRWQLSRAVPQRDENGNIQMWVGTSTDIQDQKTFTNELEKQVEIRTKELAQNNIELSKMNKELQSFTYISSHDLQEPLRKIQTFASRIDETENLSDRAKEYFTRMKSAAARMQILIRDLLSYSRTNTEERKYEKTDLRQIVKELSEDLKEELQEKQGRIEATELCDVNIIPFQFRQLLVNLVGNSLKFAKPSEPPVIKITSSIGYGSEFRIDKLLANNRYCQISVSDNGIGFEQKYSDRIFDLFQRLHGKTEYEGTGIGLAIVKKIVENHNGSITATSELGKGTTFDIYLPAESLN